MKGLDYFRITEQMKRRQVANVGTDGCVKEIETKSAWVVAAVNDATNVLLPI